MPSNILDTVIAVASYLESLDVEFVDVYFAQAMLVGVADQVDFRAFEHKEGSAEGVGCDRFGSRVHAGGELSSVILKPVHQRFLFDAEIVVQFQVDLIKIVVDFF